MRLTLKDAIQALTIHAASGHRMKDFQREIGVVLAAARAFSCEECKGEGEIFVAVADSWVTCKKCDASRVLANGGCDYP